MRKILSFFAFVAIVISFAACGGKDGNNPSINGNNGGYSNPAVEQQLIGMWESTYPSGQRNIHGILILNENHTGSIKLEYDSYYTFTWNLVSADVIHLAIDGGSGNSFSREDLSELWFSFPEEGQILLKMTKAPYTAIGPLWIH